MLELLDTLGRAALPSIWMPTLIWTLCAAAVWGGLRVASTRLSALSHYWMRMGLLLSLPLGIVAAVWMPQFSTETSGALALWGGALSEITVQAASIGGTATSPLFVGIGLLTLAAGAGAVYAMLHLLRDGYALHRLRNTLTPYAPDDVQVVVDTLAQRIGVQRPVQVHVSESVATPMTCGGRHPLLLLPPDVADDEQALRLAVLHELVHIQRWDYLLALGIRVVRACAVAHPFVHHLHHEIEQYREVACDATVCAQPQVQRSVYARLLLRLAQRSAAPSPVLRLAQSSSTLKPRLHAMSDFSRSTHPRISLLMSGLLLVATLGVMACTDTTSEDPPAANEDAPIMNEAGDAYVVVDTSPNLEGGMQALYENISYPDVAQEHGVQGRVVVQFIVDADGNVQAPTVVESPEVGDSVPGEAVKALETEGIEAVESVSFTPGQQDGVPVDVQMSLPVMFQLSE